MMRPNPVAEIERAHDFARSDIDHVDGLPVGPGLSDAGIAVDRHVGVRAVRRRDDFVPRDPALGHVRDLPRLRGIDDPEGSRPLVGDQQDPARTG